VGKLVSSRDERELSLQTYIVQIARLLMEEEHIEASEDALEGTLEAEAARMRFTVQTYRLVGVDMPMPLCNRDTSVQTP